jgi:ubiquinone/menaquinone biosynthesis C-methylase UbiE
MPLQSPAMEFREVYRNHADRYHELVSAEDADENLRLALYDVFGDSPGRLLDVGAGTGRVSRLLLEQGASVVALEPEAAMLDVARKQLGKYVPHRLELVQGDGRALPFEDARMRGAVAGWVFGHFRYWEEADWREHIARALAEMQRVIAPDTTLVVIETLGTAQETAAPPNDRLGEYYAWLEQQGFARRQFATDYSFVDAESAARCLGFFFGPEIEARVLERGWARVPEWTGMWTRQGGRGVTSGTLANKGAL